MDSLLLKTPTNSSIITYPSCSLAAPIMDDITSTTHTQTVYLKANKLPPFTQSVRHWNISSTHGILPAIDPEDNATYLGTLPGRIVTVSMLQRSCHLQIMTVLLLIWIYALCCRFPPPRRAISRLDTISSRLLVLVVLCFAYADQLMLCEAMVAFAAFLCGGGLDIMGVSPRMVPHGHYLDGNLRRVGHGYAQFCTRLRNILRVAAASRRLGRKRRAWLPSLLFLR
jgi:hypothetical protein